MEHWVTKITDILKQNGYSDVEFDYIEENEFYFEGYSDALQEIRVDLKGTKLSVYDRYVAEKHYVHFGDFSIFDWV